MGLVGQQFNPFGTGGRYRVDHMGIAEVQQIEQANGRAAATLTA
jgi:hypothetical protein